MKKILYLLIMIVSLSFIVSASPPALKPFKLLNQAPPPPQTKKNKTINTTDGKHPITNKGKHRQNGGGNKGNRTNSVSYIFYFPFIHSYFSLYPPSISHSFYLSFFCSLCSYYYSLYEKVLINNGKTTGMGRERRAGTKWNRETERQERKMGRRLPPDSNFPL